VKTVDVEKVLLETDQFTWSRDQGALVIRADSDKPNRYSVVAGIPNGDRDCLLQQWLTAVFYAIPNVFVEDADFLRADQWEDGPKWAIRVRLSLPRAEAVDW
jgi:hypothetical protein